MSHEPADPGAKLTRTDDEWREVLSAQQYRVTRQKGTEHAFTGEYWNCQRKGMYRCVCCGTALFGSEAKYDSGTGWPSFWEPVQKEAIETADDSSLSLRRVEVLCRRCGAHLGHVFADGPQPTGLRYCINSASLQLDEAAAEPRSG